MARTNEGGTAMRTGIIVTVNSAEHKMPTISPEIKSRASLKLEAQYGVICEMSVALSHDTKHSQTHSEILICSKYTVLVKTKQKNRLKIQPQIIGHRRGQNGREQRQ